VNRFQPFSNHELLIIGEGFDYLDYPDPEQALTRRTYHQMQDELIEEMDKRKLLPIDPEAMDACEEAVKTNRRPVFGESIPTTLRHFAAF
jgi:hypothetical protein